MKKSIAYSLLSMVVVVLPACSNDSAEKQQDHVFKSYENALEKAEQVQPQLEEAEEKRKKQLEEMLR